MKRFLILTIWLILSLFLLMFFLNCKTDKMLLGNLPPNKNTFLILFFLSSFFFTSGILIVDLLINKKKNIVLNYLSKTKKIDSFTFLSYDIRKDKLTLSKSLKDFLEIDDSHILTLRNFFEYIHDKDRKKILRITSKMIKGMNTELISDNIFRIVNTNQKIQYFKFEIYTTLSKDGRVIKFLVDLQNVSEIERIRNKMEDYQSKLQIIINNLPMGLYIKKVGSFKYEEWNKRAEIMTGYSQSSVVGHTDDNFRSKSSAEFERIDDMSIVENNKIIEYEDIIMSSKRKKNLYFKTHKIQVSIPKRNSDIIIGVMNDITNLKEAEFELKASRQRLIEIVNLTKIGWIYYDIQKNTVRLSDITKRQINAPIKQIEFEYDELFGYFNKEDWNELYNKLHTNEDLQNIDFILRSKDIKYFYNIKLQAYFDTKNYDEHVIQYKGTLQDITDLKQYEIEIEKNKNFLQSIIDNITVGICIINEKFEVIFANKKMSKFIQIEYNKIFERTIFDVLPSLNINYIQDLFNDSSIDKEQILNSKLEVIHKDGKKSFFNLISSNINIDTASKQNILLILDDITEKTELEEQIHQKDKLQAIGQLVSGIAHDFNNQLMGIKGYASMLEDANIIPKYSNYIHHIQIAADRSAELIKNLLLFSRTGRFQKSKNNLHSIIDETIRLIQAGSTNIYIDTDYQAKLSTMDCSISHIQNAILNMGINARDAMPQGGKLLFKTQNKNINEIKDKLQITNCLISDFIELEITDTGTGIDEKTLKKIFEPFFTTKAKGKGTGLGLATVYGAITAHNGYIAVDSKLGIGTTFNIYLPVVKDIIDDNTSHVPFQTPIYGEGHIVLVDDEKIVCSISKTILESLGYKITAFESPIAAFEYYKQNKENVDLFISDMQMPEITGIDLLHKIRNINKDAKFIIMSGCIELDGTIDLNKDKNLGFIQKPVDKIHLSVIVANFIGIKETNNIYQEGDISIAEEMNQDLSIQRILGKDAYEYIKISFSDDDEIITDILVDFVEANVKFCENISNMIAKLDYELAYNEMHKIKSILGTLGNSKLASLAQELEMAFQNKDKQNIIILFDIFNNDYTKYISNLEQIKILNKPQSIEFNFSNQYDETLLQAEIQTILSKLEEFNLLENSIILEQVQNVIWDNSFKLLVPEIYNFIKELNYAKAKELLIVMLNNMT